MTGSAKDIAAAVTRTAHNRHGIANLWQGARLREQQGGGAERLAGLGQRRAIAEALFKQSADTPAPVHVLQDIARFAGQYGNDELLAAACAFAAHRPAVIGALFDGARLHDHHTRCMPEVSRYLSACKAVAQNLPCQQLQVKQPYREMIERLADDIRRPEDYTVLIAAAQRFRHDERFWGILHRALDRICMPEMACLLLRMNLAQAAKDTPVNKPSAAIKRGSKPG